ncbi:MAG TPA: hypothetical protein PLD20_34840 [Blastocatellia bacterium]|nr:hypothetical protein [Blastocatellia bacterium]HMV86158.1 hypothetical protein [Blastocatellia bacterium]HMY71680.1 hypothetical protein [Blastocatellia bacterium]HMZ23153.1 hypothetical protein [Blastocatellia bacterium]HNG33135.1 hypothetical protein [Blastocatellia bacterium]
MSIFHQPPMSAGGMNTPIQCSVRSATNFFEYSQRGHQSAISLKLSTVKLSLPGFSLCDARKNFSLPVAGR